MYRPDLQGLRAIAVIVVVLSHSGISWFKGGFVGVDVFFVLSGFLITGLLLRELQQTRNIDFLSFYARRLRRLFPALLVMLVGTFLIGGSLLLRVEISELAVSAPFAVSWSSNIYFAFEEIQYFNNLPVQDFFLHTWSLGVEEQFYLLWPALLMLFVIARKRLGVGRLSLRGIMLAGFLSAFILSFGLSLYWTSQEPRLAFYMMPSRIWQFSLGGMLALWLSDGNTLAGLFKDRDSSKLASLVLCLGLVLIVGSTLGLHPRISWPGYWALLPSLGAALVILSGAGLSAGKQSPLSVSPLVWIGDRSYSWYLWHWPLLMIGFALGYKSHALAVAILILLSLLIAALSYRMVELPFWKGKYASINPRSMMAPFLAIMTLCVALTIFGLRQLPEPGTDEDISNILRNYPVIYGMNCDSWYASAKVTACVFGDMQNEKKVVLLGDSITAQWFSMVRALYPEPEWTIIVLTKSACPMIDEDYFYTVIGRTYEVCSNWRKSVIDYVNKLSPELLFTGSSITYPFSKTQWIEGSKRLFDRMPQSGTQVLVIPGTPRLEFDGPLCLARHIYNGGKANSAKCMSKGMMQKASSVTAYLQQAAELYPNVYILDLNDLVCPGNKCNALHENGLTVFRDDRHLTDLFVKSQVPLIRERLNALLGGY